MYHRKGKRRLAAGLLALCMLAGTGLPGGRVRAEYIHTNRDTLPAGPAMEVKEESVEAYEKLYETAGAAYYFRDDRDIIACWTRRAGICGRRGWTRLWQRS